jgi:glycerol-3-phosphate cytidylyltransferase-like family protein
LAERLKKRNSFIAKNHPDIIAEDHDLRDKVRKLTNKFPNRLSKTVDIQRLKLFFTNRNVFPNSNGGMLSSKKWHKFDQLECTSNHNDEAIDPLESLGPSAEQLNQ